MPIWDIKLMENNVYHIDLMPFIYIYINMITNSSQFARDFLGSGSENLVSEELPQY